MTQKSATRRDFIHFLIAGAAAGGCVTAARAQTATNKTWRVAYANVTDEIPFGVAILKSMKVAAAKRPQLELTWLDNRYDTAKSLEIARTVAAGGYDLFIEYNAQQAANGPISKILKDADLKALSIQTPLPGFPLFAVDNVRAGTVSGRALAETAGQVWGASTIPVPVIIGSPELGPIFQQRAAGAQEAIAKLYPNVPFVEFSSKNDAGNARQLVFDTLTRFPDRKLMIWVHIDSMALAALAAVRNAKREQDVLIASTGGDAAIFPEIRKTDSPVIGTYSFFPEFWGEEIFALADKILKGEQVPDRSNPSDAQFVTRANIAKYYPQ